MYSPRDSGHSKHPFPALSVSSSPQGPQDPTWARHLTTPEYHPVAFTYSQYTSSVWSELGYGSAGRHHISPHPDSPPIVCVHKCPRPWLLHSEVFCSCLAMSPGSVLVLPPEKVLACLSLEDGNSIYQTDPLR